MTAVNHSRFLLDNLADVLVDLAKEMEHLGAALCADPAVAMQHSEQLQGLDRAAQSTRHLAEVLHSQHPEAALAGIQLEALRIRLQNCIETPASAPAALLARIPAASTTNDLASPC